MEYIDYKKKIFSNKNILILMYVLIVVDYILTYYGIHILKMIEEANPLMVRFMELPFTLGIVIRSLLAFLIVALLKSVEIKLKTNYKNLLRKILLIQVIPYTFHGIWLYNYFIIKIKI